MRATLGKVLAWLAGTGAAPPDHAPMGARPRSPLWPKVRAEHLKVEPVCQACGGKVSLQVHHVVPFHVDYTRELDPGNLLTLCEAPGRNCHLIWGHFLSFADSWNPDARKDANRYLERVRSRPTATIEMRSH